MSKESISNVNEDSLEKLGTMRISSFDDDDDEDEGVVYNNEDADEDDDDDEEEDEEEEEQAPVTLGFVQKPKQKWSLLRQVFPSKAGGTAAWLDPIDLPSGRSCVCDFCGEPLLFLLQVYAPLSEKESAFHRTLFVFMCPSMSCLLQDQHEQWKHHPEKALRSIKVFRCQLARSNQFYSSEPPKNNGSDKPLGLAAPLCSWCGTWKGNKICGNCRKARYCSEKHQAAHWRSAHKSECRTLDITPQTSNSGCVNFAEETQKAASDIVWPEFEIINKDESDFDAYMSNSGSYAKSLLDDNEDEADAKSWASFCKRIARAPDQMLRYSRYETSEPLWPMLSGRPSKADIPKCSCGSHRAFEFQILPQLLYYFGVKNDANSLDWATVVVYTCAASCEGSLAYQDEFAWVQLTSQSTTALR